MSPNTAETPAVGSIIAVLGMHRSGTSCLAGLLENAGVFLGEVSRSNLYNKRGNNENQAIMALHDAILSANGMDWRQPSGRRCNWQPEHRTELRRILSSYPADRPWAFKDPRTLLVIEGWLESVPKLKMIGTFRHPLSTAASLATRDNMTTGESLRLWQRYNERLLELYRRFRFPLVQFDLERKSYLRQVGHAITAMGLEHSPTDMTFFDQQLRHHDANTGVLPQPVQELYHSLCEATA